MNRWKFIAMFLGVMVLAAYCWIYFNRQIRVGREVYGLQIPSGTVIVGISGFTITLSKSVREK